MRLLIADDHTLFREAIVLILETLDVDVIVVETGATQQALDLMRQYQDFDLEKILSLQCSSGCFPSS